MRNAFPGFYRTQDDEYAQILEQGTFIFDTNVLLNVFRYPNKAREMLLSILRHISNKTWIPHQVALEYHYNVLNEINSQNMAYEGLIRSLNDRYQAIEEDFKKYARRHSNLQMDTDLLSNLRISLDKVVEDLKEQKNNHPDLFEIQEEMSDLIGENIGEEYTQERLEKIYEDGNTRYSLKIPPGFKDSKKGEELRVHNGIAYKNKYGDLILWNQILHYFKKEEQEESCVVFITDDTKSDWWKDIKGEKRPDPYLIQEFSKVCPGKKIYIYHTKQFLKYASKLTGIILEEEAINDAIQSINEYKKSSDLAGSAMFVQTPGRGTRLKDSENIFNSASTQYLVKIGFYRNNRKLRNSNLQLIDQEIESAFDSFFGDSYTAVKRIYLDPEQGEAVYTVLTPVREDTQSLEGFLNGFLSGWLDLELLSIEELDDNGEIISE
ncbi:PIN-like domain-containing protein [Priestia megaterium]|uniref:PIN-like domain-containing protein n=1 Tax=Priestia megaterium TaxID=1404 RepID=UPI00339A252F